MSRMLGECTLLCASASPVHHVPCSEHNTRMRTRSGRFTAIRKRFESTGPDSLRKYCENAFRAPIRRFRLFGDVSCHHFDHGSDYFDPHFIFVLAFVHSLRVEATPGPRDFARVLVAPRHTPYLTWSSPARMWAIQKVLICLSLP